MEMAKFRLYTDTSNLSLLQHGDFHFAGLLISSFLLITINQRWA